MKNPSGAIKALCLIFMVVVVFPATCLAATPPTTTLSIYPGVPDGTGGWYRLRPMIVLTRNKSGGTFYQWNTVKANSWTTYSFYFLCPDGKNRLKYFSVNNNGKEELVTSDLIKVDTKSPWTRLRSPSYATMRSKNTVFRVYWSAKDAIPSSAIATYNIKYKKGPNGAWRSWPGSVPKKNGNFKGATGQTYYFIGKSKDKAGNRGWWSKVKSTVVPYDERVFSRQGNWTKRSSSRLYLGHSQYSSSVNSSAVYNFKSARRVALIITKNSKGGLADVYIGDRKVKTVDFYSAKSRYRRPVTIAQFPYRRNGWLRVVVTGNKNPASNGYRVELDGVGIKR